MKIKSIERFTAYTVEAEDGTFYERHGDGDRRGIWYKWDENSIEEVEDMSKSEELETLLQNFVPVKP